MIESLSPLRSGLQRAASALRSLDASIGWDAASALLAQRLLTRIERDLLPRLGTDNPLLLVAIAGPNNVGKSSLFNSLVGQAISPARAEGGLTKQCLAAAHPSVWSPELRALLDERYEIVQPRENERIPVDEPGPPGRLYLWLSARMPTGLLLMDTPDFDSIYRENRERAEALLVTVDLIVFMVSRHTYQNAALVDFIREAVGHGRPYALVYNEAPQSDVAAKHLQKLVQDVGAPPIGQFAAAHQPQVEAGEAPLQTEPLSRQQPSLPALLSESGHIHRLKAKALAASLANAAAELSSVAGAVEASAKEAERLRARVRHELSAVGGRAAMRAVPADVLVEALRDELDARSAFHRWVRLPFRGLATALTFVGRRIRRSFEGTPAPQPVEAVKTTEQVLRDGVRQTMEALAPELSAWRGEAAIRELLGQALGPRTLAALDGGPLDLPELSEQRKDKAELYAFCRELLANELSGGMKEEALQGFATLVYSVPASAAAIVTLATGGLGHDVIIWTGTLLSTPLLERLVDMLGRNVRLKVSNAWAASYGQSLARGLERLLFQDLLTALDAKAARAQAVVSELTSSREQLLAYRNATQGAP